MRLVTLTIVWNESSLELEIDFNKKPTIAGKSGAALSTKQIEEWKPAPLSDYCTVL